MIKKSFIINLINFLFILKNLKTYDVNFFIKLINKDLKKYLS